MALPVFGLAIVRDAAGAIVWGASGAFAASPGGYQVINDSSDYDADWGREDIENTDGSLATTLVKRVIEKLTIEVVPVGATFTAAVASAVIPGPMAQVTISGATLIDTGTTQVPASNNGINGVWNCVSGCSVKSKKAGATMISLKLERYDGAALTQVVIGS
jgi:hypothetical protein